MHCTDVANQFQHIMFGIKWIYWSFTLRVLYFLKTNKFQYSGNSIIFLPKKRHFAVWALSWAKHYMLKNSDFLKWFQKFYYGLKLCTNESIAAYNPIPLLIIFSNMLSSKIYPITFKMYANKWVSLCLLIKISQNICLRHQWMW